MSPVARALLSGDPGARLAEAPAPGRALAQVAAEKGREGVAAFRKSLLDGAKPGLKAGATIRTADGRTATFLSRVGDGLAYVRIGIDGFTTLVPISAIEVFDAAGERTSTEVPGGTQGGYPGAGASLDASKVAAFHSSLEGQLLLAKTTISEANAPARLGFFDKASGEGRPKFQQGDRVRHLPSGRHGKFVASASGTHGHVVFDGGEALTCALDDLEPASTAMAGHADVPPFDGDSGRRGMSSQQKVAYFSSQQGQLELSKLVRPSGCSAVGASASPRTSLGAPGPGISPGPEPGGFIEKLNQEIGEAVLRLRRAEAGRGSRPLPLVKAPRSLRPGDFVEHRPTGRRYEFVAQASPTFAHLKTLNGDGAYLPTAELTRISASVIAGYSNCRP
jgi:hypothetical protein